MFCMNTYFYESMSHPRHIIPLVGIPYLFIVHRCMIHSWVSFFISHLPLAGAVFNKSYLTRDINHNNSQGSGGKLKEDQELLINVDAKRKQ